MQRQRQLANRTRLGPVSRLCELSEELASCEASPLSLLASLPLRQAPLRLHGGSAPPAHASSRARAEFSLSWSPVSSSSSAAALATPTARLTIRFTFARAARLGDSLRLETAGSPQLYWADGVAAEALTAAASARSRPPPDVAASGRDLHAAAASLRAAGRRVKFEVIDLARGATWAEQARRRWRRSARRLSAPPPRARPHKLGLGESAGRQLSRSTLSERSGRRPGAPAPTRADGATTRAGLGSLRSRRGTARADDDGASSRS